MIRLDFVDARRIGLILAAVCVLTARAEAQEYCVACTGPTALYRCIIEGARPGGSQPLQTLCATAMAKEGQHAACSVKGGTVFECTGPVKRVPWANYNPTAPKAPGQEAAPKAQAPATDPNQPPKTIEEMAKRANQQTAEQIKKANEDVKGQVDAFNTTTKKTWQCITSLFTRCNEP
ncbi:MAG: hypothetical protein K2X43_25090 [Hyphomonadaceae bacterium]|nr:hypothetical protein [Hyphomonadaceae bacterium]